MLILRAGSRQRQAEAGAGRQGRQALRRRPDGKHFAVWGLAFKPNTDDMREAPSRVLLAAAGARRHGAVYDPVAMAEARRVLALDLTGTGCRVRFADSPMDALTGADALVIVTEWKAFRSPDFEQIKAR
jgi:UDPglucose 6-dehydrogenase